MAGASDKARFYLEQGVPELREWERREIFSKVCDLGILAFDLASTTRAGRNLLHCGQTIRL